MRLCGRIHARARVCVRVCVCVYLYPGIHACVCTHMFDFACTQYTYFKIKIIICNYTLSLGERVIYIYIYIHTHNSSCAWGVCFDNITYHDDTLACPVSCNKQITFNVQPWASSCHRANGRLSCSKISWNHGLKLQLADRIRSGFEPDTEFDKIRATASPPGWSEVDNRVITWSVLSSLSAPGITILCWICLVCRLLNCL